MLSLVFYMLNKMEEINLRECNYKRIDVEFKDKEFWEKLKKWKNLCSHYNGGQTKRIQLLIEKDLKNIKEDIIKGLN